MRLKLVGKMDVVWFGQLVVYVVSGDFAGLMWEITKKVMVCWYQREGKKQIAALVLSIYILLHRKNK